MGLRSIDDTNRTGHVQDIGFRHILRNNHHAGVLAALAAFGSVVGRGEGQQLSGIPVDQVIATALAEEQHGIVPQDVQINAMQELVRHIDEALTPQAVRHAVPEIIQRFADLGKIVHGHAGSVHIAGSPAVLNGSELSGD